MKKNRVNKVLLFGVAVLTSLSFTSNSYASEESEASCKVYKDYYLFNLIKHKNTLYNEEGTGILDTSDIFKSTHSTVFEIDKNLTRSSAKITREGIVCLKRSDNDTENCTEEVINKHTLASNNLYMETMTLTDFFKAHMGKYEESTVIKNEKDAGIEVQVLHHGKWINYDGSREEANSSIDFAKKVSLDNIIKGTLLPDYSDDFTALGIQSDRKNAIVKRVINKTKNGNDEVVAFDIDRDDDGNATEAEKSYVIPGMFYIKYELCTYNATINYYYFKDGEITTDRVKDDDGKEVQAWTKSNLDPGYTKPVNSPKISGCTIVDENGKPYDEDKVVKITIDETNPKDFNKNVYYYCKVEEEPTTNGKTGDALIYIAWAIGIGALGYSAYYFMNSNKEKKEEI